MDGICRYNHKFRRRDNRNNSWKSPLFVGRQQRCARRPSRRGLYALLRLLPYHSRKADKEIQTCVPASMGVSFRRAPGNISRAGHAAPPYYPRAQSPALDLHRFYIAVSHFYSIFPCPTGYQTYRIRTCIYLSISSPRFRHNIRRPYETGPSAMGAGNSDGGNSNRNVIHHLRQTPKSKTSWTR